MKYVLFTGSRCKNCAPMKRNMDKVGIRFEEISTDTTNGKKMSGICKVSCLPFLALMRDGKPIETYPGLLPIGKLQAIKLKYGGK